VYAPLDRYRQVVPLEPLPHPVHRLGVADRVERGDTRSAMAAAGSSARTSTCNWSIAAAGLSVGACAAQAALTPRSRRHENHGVYMGRLLLLSFGTFAETNRFKRQAVSDGLVASDAMHDESPGGLVLPGGVRLVNAAEATTVSFYGLTPARWSGRTAANVPFHQAFEAWMKGVLGQPVECAYLTGHHAAPGGRANMWWADGVDEKFFAYLGTPGSMSFGVVKVSTQQVANRIMLAAGALQSQCRLVVGFGCDIATAANSLHYQSFFANGARKPIVLGWASSMNVPSTGPSVNDRFFAYLRAYAQVNASVPPRDRLAWFYERAPMVIIRAWGHGVLPYRGGTMWEAARARHSDGTFYKFAVADGAAIAVAA
jgi:hypothetical protein